MRVLTSNQGIIMKTQPVHSASSSCLHLSAVILMAAFPMVQSTAQDLSGTFFGSFPDIPAGGFTSSISNSDYRRGAIAQMKITGSGAFTLAVTFANRVHRQTGVLSVRNSEHDTEPVYEADLGKSASGLKSRVLFFPPEYVELVCSTLEEDNAYSAALGPAVRRDADAIHRPGAYNTVHLRPDLIATHINDEVTQGVGFGGLRVGASGISTFVGALPDGQGVTGGGQLVRASFWPFRVPIMLRTPTGRDLLIGDLPAIDHDHSSSDQVYGTLIWSKGPSPRDPLAPAGWRRSTQAETSAYAPPARGERLIPGAEDGPQNMFIALASGGRWIADSFGFLEKPFTLTNANRAVFQRPNKERLEVDFYASTGFFTGKFLLQTTQTLLRAQMVQFRGMVRTRRFDDLLPLEVEYAPTGTAEGFFLAPPPAGTLNVPLISGSVLIMANPFRISAN